MAENSGKLLIPESDYVSVYDADGNELEHKVPKAWVGTDLLPPGVTGKAKESKESQGGEPEGDKVPSKSASREDLKRANQS